MTLWERQFALPIFFLQQVVAVWQAALHSHFALEAFRPPLLAKAITMLPPEINRQTNRKQFCAIMAKL